MRSHTVPLAVVLPLVLSGAGTAAAQIAAGPRLAGSIAGGIALPFHSDLDFTAGTWQIGVRGAVAAHAAVEVFFDEWRHSSDRDLPGGTFVGSSGVVTHYGQLTERTSHLTRTMGFNALATGSSGRVLFAAGGGVGYFSYRRVFEQELFACQPAGAEICQPFTRTHTSSSFSMQIVSSVDVVISSRTPVVLAFGQVQFIAPVDDFGFGHTKVLGGIRIGVR